MIRRVPASPRLLVAASAALLVLMWPAAANACPVCFGETHSPMAQGMNNAIWVLLGLVGFVQLGFIALFWNFWRRARAIRKRREQFRLIPSPHSPLPARRGEGSGVRG